MTWLFTLINYSINPWLAEDFTQPVATLATHSPMESNN